MIRVAIDAMGGDLGPRIAFESALNVLQNYDDVDISIYHHESFSPIYPSHLNVTTIACPDFILQNDVVNRDLFRRQETTLYKALKSLAKKHSDVVITLGNTGVMVALSRFILGLVRPKLYPALIRELGSSPLRCLVDLGANVHCQSTMLEGFACLGAAYIEACDDQLANVGLLNVGVESSKGSSVIREADKALSKRAWPIYSGYAEGDEIFKGDKNVIVCDGMVGNAVLKASEGLLSFINKELSDSHDKDIVRSLFKGGRNHGACLVGVAGNVVKGHGGSDVTALTGAIEYGIDMAKNNLHEKISAKIKKEVV
ncbi:fatty acid synthesis protein [Marinomonas sp. 15G1-11]|uniref:Phosphate acyltransferase n=1 Tax=Marinomonas phaeophyticola TaxID=3004091 RepID=A0ABT4JQ02_9GAMM|nr:fatty acid synthesis protein [Marinomonas sp. 15G1-11]MCZ2720236.1 fatty acid synthesis protein [Marinomonas sp. 15G1-11]